MNNKIKLDLPGMGSQAWKFDFDDSVKLIKSFGLQFVGVIIAASIVFFEDMIAQQNSLIETQGPIVGMVVVGISTVVLNGLRLWKRDNQK